MKGSINKYYQQWLEKFIAQNPRDRTTVGIARTIINGLPEALSCAQLIALFSHMTPHQYLESATVIHVYGPIRFYATLEEWKQKLAKLQADHNQCQVLLATALKTQKTEKLISLLQAILDNPMSLLHCHTPSLLKLMKENLAEILEIVNQLKEIPSAEARKPAPRGSFAALAPLDNKQGDAIELLKQLCAKVQEQNPAWIYANSILQCSLCIYKETSEWGEDQDGLEKKGQKKPAA